MAAAAAAVLGLLSVPVSRAAARPADEIKVASATSSLLGGASFRLPVPGMLPDEAAIGLMGLALLGLAAAVRRSAAG